MLDAIEFGITTGAMTMVKIIIRTQGQCFATYAVVKQGRKVLHLTRDYPYSFTGTAYQAAENWAQEHGYSVS
jgi:hypothetical protein